MKSLEILKLPLSKKDVQCAESHFKGNILETLYGSRLTITGPGKNLSQTAKSKNLMRIKNKLYMLITFQHYDRNADDPDNCRFIELENGLYSKCYKPELNKYMKIEPIGEV